MIYPGLIAGRKPNTSIDELYAEFASTDANAATILDEIYAEVAWADGGTIADEIFAEFAIANS